MKHPHTRAERRIVRTHQITRKKRICNHRKTSLPQGVTGPTRDLSVDYPMDWYQHDGMYSKGKIHCSCKMCKYSKYFKLPTLRDIKEEEKFKNELEERYVS